MQFYRCYRLIFGKPGSEAWNSDCKSSAARKNESLFCISADCSYRIQSHALDSSSGERNAAALWAKDSSPPWHKSYTISKRLRVSRLLEVLRTNGSGIVLLSITATLRLHHTCPCLVFLLQVCGPSWAATQGHPRSRCLKTRLLKIHGMVWNGMETGFKYTQHHFLHIYICNHIHDTIHIYRFDCSDEQLRREKCSGKSWILYFKCQESC